ncbi:MAG: (deoxy)nucleoside triphosphate pyrophosphohydrolase [Burkholderiales bacterium]|nr:(deoxy)nucleoside triphosphate pyrophosphohydrolase [Burkholderiales bacterium]
MSGTTIKIWTMPDKPVVSVVGAAIESGGRILCLRRGKCKNEESSFKYEFPGGKVEEGETPETALQRELLEELNIEVPVVPENYLSTSVHEFDHMIVELSVYLVHASKVKFSLKEHIQYIWLDAKDLPSLEWSPADVAAVKLLAAR